MVKVYVDGTSIEAPVGANLLHVVLSAGLDLPYFCWHPELGSLGACRQCAVVVYRDEHDTTGRLTMSCMTPVAEGMRLSLKAQSGVDFRAGVVEFLMRNHPHDCPVCEEGGECHLQDVTVMSGHTARRYAAPKRTFRNQELGPFLNHEMNRCITCYRCVRFYRDYAGGTDLQALGSRDRTFFGRAQDGTLENAFAGNLVEVCPTGVFTDKPFSQSFTRKWDLQSAPSICTNCAVGCNLSASERYGKLKRVHNRYHQEVNGYFLCDRGRFGFHYVNGEDERLRRAGRRTAEGSYEVVTTEAGIAFLAERVRAGRALGVGSPRASLEANAALRALVGDANFGHGMAEAEFGATRLALDIYESGIAHIPTLAEIESADAVLVLGEDVLNTAPRIALALRQAVHGKAFEVGAQAAIPEWQDAGIRSHGRRAKNPLFVATVLPGEDADLAQAHFHGAPDAIAACGQAIAAAIDLGRSGEDFVTAAASALANAKRPLVVAGTSLAHCGVLEAARAVAQAIAGRGTQPALCLLPLEANSLGVARFGGVSVDAVLAAIERGEVDTLVVVENELHRRADPARVAAALTRVPCVIALDSVVTNVVENAELVLPSAAFAECEGSYVNYETRAQRAYQVFEPAEPITPAWRWLAAAAAINGRERAANWQHVDDLLADLDAIPGFAGVATAGPDAGYRPSAGTNLARKVPRQPHRYSGRTAMLANVSVHEPKQPEDAESALAFSMEGTLQTASPLVPYVWSPGWNSNQALIHFQQEAGGATKGGTLGVRLVQVPVRLDAPRVAASSFATPSPPDADALRAVPFYRIFGSDELSARSSPVAQRGERAFVTLHPDDAARLGVAEGDDVLVSERASEHVARLRLMVVAAMPRGTIGYARGLIGSFGHLPQTLSVRADPAAPRVIART